MATYEAKRPDGKTITVTVPESDSDRELELAIGTLRAVADWASDRGPFKGLGPMDLADRCRQALRLLGEKV